jgi:Zn-dependent membrane protease YugP
MWVELALILLCYVASIVLGYMMKNTYRKYGGLDSRAGVTGAEAAQKILTSAGIRDVTVAPVAGLDDKYDSKTKTVMLSENVFGSTSVAAVCRAAHEAAHAVKQEEGGLAFSVRAAINPAMKFSAKATMPLICLGAILSYGAVMEILIGFDIGVLLLDIGVVLMFALVAYELVSLPVEFGASQRAIELLYDNKLLTEYEIAPAKEILIIAAWTYVAAAMASAAALARIVIRARRRSVR